MWEAKRDTFILSCNKSRGNKEFLGQAIALVLTLLCLAGSLSCQREKESARTGLPGNSPPQIVSLKMLPENPNKDSVFSLIIESFDSDYDRVLYRYQWVKNDEDLDGENKEILKEILLKRGDLVRVKVTPSDGKTEGKTFLSPAVKILNSPPVIKEIGIEPKIAYAGDDLKALVKVYDADGDSVTCTYQWEKNGVVLSEESKDILPRNRFRKGDSIAVAAIPNDGETSGSIKKSEPVVIVNSPPIITSSPSDKTDGNIYTYQVEADDTDGDPITFSLKNAPKGMEIDKETGLIRWQIERGDQGTQAIEIEASDNGGAKSIQRYTLSVKFR